MQETSGLGHLKTRVRRAGSSRFSTPARWGSFDLSEGATPSVRQSFVLLPPCRRVTASVSTTSSTPERAPAQSGHLRTPTT